MQSPGVALKRSSDKYHTMHKKPPVVKSRLNEAVGQQPATLLKMSGFLSILQKLTGHFFYRTTM